YPEARALLEQAIEEQAAALRARPNDQRCLSFFRSHHVALADVLEDMEQFEEAAAAYGRLAKAMAGRMQAFGDQRGYWRGMGTFHQRRGGHLGQAGKF